MPNDYRNKLTLRGERKIVERVFDSIRTKEAFNDGSDRVFDFDKVIPTPPALQIESNWGAEDMVMIYMRQAGFSMIVGSHDPMLKHAQETYDKWDDETRQKMKQLARKYLANIAEYEYPNWYSFHIDKWGTKWNSYGEQKREGDTLTFETANGYPKPVLEELSKAWPEVEFDLTAADEDIGSNTIKGTFRAGTFYGVEEHQTPKAYEIAFEMFPERKEHYYPLGDGTFAWKDDEEVG